jgi:Uma2 family endonuclease
MTDMAFEYKLREFTVEEYHRMAEVGVLRDDERVELLDGAIIEMSPIGTRHWDRHAEIVRYLNEMLGSRARIVGKGSFPLGSKNEPQPDVGILAPRSYAGRGASPGEIYAVVELADSSLRKDTGPKLRLYARFGIPDYVVDLERDVMLHYTEPHELGYRRERSPERHETFTLQRIADVMLSAAPFLTPPSP